ncbi:NADH dehydrogenase, alpha subcomplex, subunit 6 [Atractiella rhizophila]|nr:NADH dehydrogenase, alpha subcomplex, subunit 6 [Atractiella rhizophila]
MSALSSAIPSRLARAAQVSGSWPVARARVRGLYRDWYRAAPEIVSLYALPFPPSVIRAKIRSEFDKYKEVKDLEAVDVLLLKGHQEFQETLNLWKMDTHVMRWFAAEEAPAQPTTFMESFYAGRDDPAAVRPTA